MTKWTGRTARFVCLVLLVVWCFASWKLSSQSDPETYVGFHVALPDKLEHGFQYALGAFLAAGALSDLSARSAWTVSVVFCASWGTLDEIHQGWVPDRDSSGMDLAADVIGATIGALCFVCGPGRAKPARRDVDEPSEPKKEPTRP